MLNDDELDRYVEEALKLVQKTADELRRDYGIGKFERWDLDQVSGVLTFSDPDRTTVRAECYAVGTLADGTWKWAWANSSVVPDLAKDSVKLRALTQRTGLEIFEKECFNVDADMPWEICGMALREIGGLGAYRCGTEDKALFVIIRSISSTV